VKGLLVVRELDKSLLLLGLSWPGLEKKKSDRSASLPMTGGVRRRSKITSVIMGRVTGRRRLFSPPSHLQRTDVMMPVKRKGREPTCTLDFRHFMLMMMMMMGMEMGCTLPHTHNAKGFIWILLETCPLIIFIISQFVISLFKPSISLLVRVPANVLFKKECRINMK
jgi:hypothetical protein